MVEHCSENFTESRIPKKAKSSEVDQQLPLMELKRETSPSNTPDWSYTFEVDSSCRGSNYSGSFIVHLQGNNGLNMGSGAVGLSEMPIPDVVGAGHPGSVEGRMSRGAAGVIGAATHQHHHHNTINSNSNGNTPTNNSNNTHHHHHHHHHHNGTNNASTNGNNLNGNSNHHHHSQPQHNLHPHHHQQQQQQLHPNSLVTQDDHKPFICAGCGDLITERYYLNVANNAWHFNCLKCYECKSTLDSERSCYERMGNYYCREDYQRLFNTQRCARCNMGIQSTDLVMRARNHVYHVTCFTCFTCNKALQAGDTFGLRDHLVYCQIHYENSYHAEYIALSPDMNAGQLPYYNGVGTLQKGRPRKRRSPNISSDEFAQNIGLGHDGLDRPGDMIDRDTYQNAPRQKRMRTSFKHHQLRTLKSYFAVNHNPDAKDLKHLAQKTGLTKRVLQVWFQNARAKFRRNCQKQEQDRVSGGGQPGQNQSSQGSDKSGNADSQAIGELSNERSPGLSDISSAPSLSDLQGSCLDSDHSNSLSDFFTGNIASLSS